MPFYYSARPRKNQQRFGRLTQLTGFLLIIAGILILLCPAATLLGIPICIGIYLLFYGILAVGEFIAD